MNNPPAMDRPLSSAWGTRPSTSRTSSTIGMSASSGDRQNGSVRFQPSRSVVDIRNILNGPNEAAGCKPSASPCTKSVSIGSIRRQLAHRLLDLVGVKHEPLFHQPAERHGGHFGRAK